ncbi:DUF2812 domain-containing protein [Terrisporobacter vanillatitrophus]|uniref:DUF2812 domain-containing protein n=1 Tax=Terrisporobacter vanillatitrophus TaxID=3058402 RepID=UPI003369511D
MKIGENKLLKINTFDLLDTESLEAYLSKKALEGWMISKVSKILLTFEKTDPKPIKFFVDITDRHPLEIKYVPTKEYIDSAKEENLEHICGNDDLQIFINRGSPKRIKKKKLKFSKVFMAEFGILINIFLIILLSLLNYLSSTKFFILFISNKSFIIWTIAITIFIMMPYLVLGYISIGYLQLDNSSNISKEEMPLSLEDFNVDIQKGRECTKSSSSSPFAKYVEYYDDTYKETIQKAYDEASNSHYNEYSQEYTASILYSIFESEYDKIMDKALDSFLDEYSDYDVYYKKLTDKDELKNWGAKEVYASDFMDARIVVYDNRIITISSELGYNKENINMIKRKIGAQK